MTRVGVTIDCTDLVPMAEFWAETLGYRVGGRDGKYQWLGDPDSEGPEVILQLVPEPRNGKNRLHLDIYANDIEYEAKRICALGARKIDSSPIEEAGNRWLRLADPEGNEFCIVQAH
jgi:predicted enzyme related to lactoylglutathione lyase